MKLTERKSGVLLHPTSLPSPYGIGTLGKEAYQFVDFLEKAGQSYWQILPLNPTGFGDSPYQSNSAFAGNPYFIDLPTLFEKGYISREELYASESENKYSCDFSRLQKAAWRQFPVLSVAEKRSFNTSSQNGRMRPSSCT